MTLFWCGNGATPTTAAFAKVATGTAIKTMLQVKPGANNAIKVREWGISFDGVSAANTPVQCELLTTGTVSVAAVTAHVAAGVQPYQDYSVVPVSTVSLGTTATGFTSSSTEGSITTTRIGDMQMISPTTGYVKQFPLGSEFYVKAAEILRIRVTAATDVNCWCYIVWEE